MTDTIESHIHASPEQCERVMAALRSHDGASVTNLEYWSGIRRVVVMDALEQMEKRGAVRHDGARWYGVVR